MKKYLADLREMVTSHRSLLKALSIVIALLSARMLWYDSLYLSFLIWNAFLAGLPLLFSYYVTRTQGLRRALHAMLWMLFFPNAAYLITDIVHLNIREGTGFWLDLVILFGAGMWGVVAGLRSLAQMERWYSRYFTRRTSSLITLAILVASGYGIYLGRVERWNSWDLFFNTHDLISSIFHELRHPIRCIEAWEMSGIFAAALSFCYIILQKKDTAQ